MSLEVRQSPDFVTWLATLRDLQARFRILQRIRRHQVGRRGISEMRITYGPGYRVYYTRHGDRIVILLCGGDKSSQSDDIARAKRIAKEL